MTTYKSGMILLVCGGIALVFLLYSLLNLRKLNIRLSHPRVMVELVLFILFSVMGFILILR